MSDKEVKTKPNVNKDDDGRSITYGITAGVPVEKHEATITVNPDGDGCTVRQDVSSRNDDASGPALRYGHDARLHVQEPYSRPDPEQHVHPQRSVGQQLVRRVAAALAPVN